MTVDYWLLIPGSFWAALIALEILWRRSVRRLDASLARGSAQLRLKTRLLGIDDSCPEWYAMQCTICGGFHVEDDDECPIGKGQ